MDCAARSILDDQPANEYPRSDYHGGRELSRGDLQESYRTKMLRAAPLTRVIIGSFGGVENQSNSEAGSLRELLGAIEGPIVNRAISR